MKLRKITKIAKVKPIKPPYRRRQISLICKLLDLTQNSEFEETKFIKGKQVPEKIHKSQDIKVIKKQQNDDLSSSQSCGETSEFMPKRQQGKVSQTKNISTSYGKMILRFMQTKKQSITSILEANSTSYTDFSKTIQYFTRHMFSVSDLRKLWLDEHHKHAKIMRILSMNFLRKYSYEYIFNSRIKMYNRNLKYRHKIIQGVKNPQDFNMLKGFDYGTF